MENQIRNFVIISHIDHGKSTLADRFLELTGTIPKDKMKPQFLDSMDLEREKGITIKMQPCRMEYNGYILNLIDTPGHVDFSYEVSRSLAAVEGAIILVDATQGIQAQTISNLELAKAQNLVIIPVINKIDSPEARIEKTKQEIANLLNISEEEVLSISAKCGTNIKELLETVIKKIPGPETNQEKPLRALIFDSKYDAFKGIIAYVRVMDGKIETAQNFYLMASKSGEKVKEVGVFKPELFPKKELKAGEIGYIATGIKKPEKIKIGDTIISDKLLMINNLVEPLPGYLEPKPMVFASFYPTDPNDYQLLKEGLVKLKLNDASLFFEPERKEMLGRGFRCGFLGSLHAEIVSERLYRESGLDLIISTPSVVLKIINQKNQETLIYSASDLPCASEIKEILEPWIELKIISPINYLNSIF
ncbi:translation elongation factor 4, partial [Candidatus Parcubacteria bacterium]|nr:translation elongation factor 4 [Candidatus Parcubacteria bacterium]